MIQTPRRTTIMPVVVFFFMLMNKRLERADIRKFSVQRIQQEQADGKFIRYSMHQDRPYKMKFSRNYRCAVGPTKLRKRGPMINRVTLADPFRELLNLQTFFQTNLKIFVFGDSLAMQFAEFLAEAGGAEEFKILRDAWPGNTHFAVSKLAGGGAIATMRMTGLWSRTKSQYRLPNSSGGGWRREHIKIIRNETAKLDGEDGLANFDAMVMRIPHGWIGLNEIRVWAMKQTIVLAHEQLGIKSVIILTLPVNNNVETKQDLLQKHHVNAQIRAIAANWNQADIDETGVEKVVIMEFGDWADISLTGRNKPLVNETDILARLDSTCAGKFPPSIAMTCASPPVVTNQKSGCKECDRNMFSLDGLHWCMESIGGHFAASISCLLECTISASGQQLRTCESKCTDRLLSMSFRNLIVMDS